MTKLTPHTPHAQGRLTRRLGACAVASTTWQKAILAEGLRHPKRPASRPIAALHIKRKRMVKQKFAPYRADATLGRESSQPMWVVSWTMMNAQLKARTFKT